MVVLLSESHLLGHAIRNLEVLTLMLEVKLFMTLLIEVQLFLDSLLDHPELLLLSLRTISEPQAAGVLFLLESAVATVIYGPVVISEPVTPTLEGGSLPLHPRLSILVFEPLEVLEVGRVVTEVSAYI